MLLEKKCKIKKKYLDTYFERNDCFNNRHNLSTESIKIELYFNEDYQVEDFTKQQSKETGTYLYLKPMKILDPSLYRLEAGSQLYSDTHP